MRKLLIAAIALAFCGALRTAEARFIFRVGGTSGDTSWRLTIDSGPDFVVVPGGAYRASSLVAGYGCPFGGWGRRVAAGPAPIIVRQGGQTWVYGAYSPYSFGLGLNDLYAALRSYREADDYRPYVLQYLAKSGYGADYDLVALEARLAAQGAAAVARADRANERTQFDRLRAGTDAFRASNFRGAAAAFRDAVVANPGDPVSLCAYAVSLCATGDYGMAAKSLRRALNEAKDPEALRLRVADLYGDPAMLPAHRERLGRWCADSPDDRDSRLCAAYLAAMCDEPEKAKAACEALLAADPLDRGASRLRSLVEPPAGVPPK